MRHQNMEKVEIGVNLADKYSILSDAVSKNMKTSARYLSLLAIVGFAALVYGASPALAAATAPDLGAAESYGILAGSTVTNTGNTVVNGWVGLFPGSAITGFPPGIVNGETHAADAAALQAKNALTAAYINLGNQPCDFGPFGPTDLASKELVPGVYCYSSTLSNTGALTLNGGGNNNAVWIFKIGSALNTGPGSTVTVINGGQDCNVFWQVGSSATLDTTTMFVGTILADASISLNNEANISGRALASTGAVTLINNEITPSMCAEQTPKPTLNKSFSPAIINTGGVSTLTIKLSNPSTSDATLTAQLIDILPTGVTIASTPNAGTTCGGTATVSAIAGETDVALSSGSIIPAAIDTTPGTCTVKVDVTAETGDSYINTLPANALKTSNGNNSIPAIATLNVTSQPLYHISGMKFNDLNDNGIKDIGEPGLEGWNIILTKPDGSTVNAITDGSGSYIFNGLTAGTYNVEEVLQSGWKQTAPIGGNYTVTLPDEVVNDKDFGNVRIGTSVPEFTPSGIAILIGLLMATVVLVLRRKAK